MNQRAQIVPATDGYELSGQWFEPEPGADKGRIVVINSATGVRQKYYAKYAAFLAEHGYRVLTYDYRGIGDSLHGKIRKSEGRMEDWGTKDFAGVLEHVAREHEGRPVLVVGHSVGGQIFGLTERSARVQALLLVAAQSGYWRHWPGFNRYLMAMLWYCFIPGTCGLLSYCPLATFGLGENLPKGVALQWAQWGRNPDYVVDDEGRPIRRNFAAFDRPILSYSFSDDGLAPKAAVDSLMEYYQEAPMERRHVEPQQLDQRAIGHFGFFRERFEATLWTDSLAWLDAH